MSRPQGLRRVNKSHVPTPDQLYRMAQNLTLVRREYCSIEIVADAYWSTGGAHLRYRVYTESTGHRDLQSWPHCQAYYYELLN